MSQVEQDLVLSRALVMLYQNPILQQQLAFRGGTALNKLFNAPLARYSEDIDLVQMYDGPIGNTLSQIRETLDPWLGNARWKQNANCIKMIYRFHSETIPPIPLRLKIEINTIDNPWFSGTANIKSYALEELMGTKLRALFQRAKGRDLYDLWMAITTLKLNCSETIEAFLYYNTTTNTHISRAQFEKNLFEKASSQNFLLDALKVLPAHSPWQPKAAIHMILTEIIQHLPGEPWKDSAHHLTNILSQEPENV